MKKTTKGEARRKIESFIELRFKNLAKNNFNGFYEYCFLSGSFAYGGGTLGKSDLDIVIVFKNEVYNLPKSELTIRVKSFIDGYLKLHKETGYLPDLVFPGEFITTDLVNDSINGRGFQLDLNNKLFLPKASTQYYLEDSERWFRAWLSQSAFNRFLHGNKRLFDKNKINAWNSILRFTLWKEKIDSFILSDIFNKLRSFGVHADYDKFKSLEKATVLKSLKSLEDLEFISYYEKGYTTNSQKLQNWAHEIANSIRNGSVKKAKFLLNLEETLTLSNYTSQTWRNINTQSSIYSIRRTS